jgi:hypothetical protein
MSEIHGPRAPAIVPVGDDLDGLFSFWDDYVRPPLA